MERGRKRAIQKQIETPLGRLMLKGEIRDDQTVRVDFDAAKGELRFVPVESREAASAANALEDHGPGRTKCAFGDGHLIH